MTYLHIFHFVGWLISSVAITLPSVGASAATVVVGSQNVRTIVVSVEREDYACVFAVHSFQGMSLQARSGSTSL